MGLRGLVNAQSATDLAALLHVAQAARTFDALDQDRGGQLPVGRTQWEPWRWAQKGLALAAAEVSSKTQIPKDTS